MKTQGTGQRGQGKGETTPTISVIIPVYNDAESLPRCLDSVLSQTQPGLEVICVDDGSTDGSGAILDGCAAAHGNVVVIRQANSGAGVARNVALNHASGEFVAFMDGDDRYCDERALQSLYEAAKRHGVKAAGGMLLNECAAGALRHNMFALASPDAPAATKDATLTLRDCPVILGYQRFIIERRLLMEGFVRFPTYARGQDPPFLAQALAMAGRFRAVDAPVYMYHRPMVFRPSIITPLATVGVWRSWLDILGTAKQFRLPKLRRLVLDLWRQHFDVYVSLAYLYITQGNTTVADVWERVAQTARSLGLDERLCLTDPGAMRAELEATVAKCRALVTRLRSAVSIVIYGAGVTGQRAARFVSEINASALRGFCVSAGQPRQAAIMGLPVRFLEDLNPNDGALIALAANEPCQTEMRGNLRRLGFANVALACGAEVSLIHLLNLNGKE